MFRSCLAERRRWTTSGSSTRAFPPAVDAPCWTLWSWMAWGCLWTAAGCRSEQGMRDRSETIPDLQRPSPGYSSQCSSLAVAPSRDGRRRIGRVETPFKAGAVGERVHAFAVNSVWGRVVVCGESEVICTSFVARPKILPFLTAWIRPSCEVWQGPGKPPLSFVLKVPAYIYLSQLSSLVKRGESEGMDFFK